MARPVYREGAQRLVRVPVDSTTVIAVGDLVWYDTDDAKPASDFTWDTNLATTQAAFAKKFLGVAVEAHTAAEGATKTHISVDMSVDSIYSFACTSDTYMLGVPLGPAEGSSTLSNTVLEDAVKASAIAFSAEHLATAGTLVKASVCSARLPQNLFGQVGAAS